MKSKYCFIRHGGELKPGDVIYQVWVGSFLSEFTKLTLVEEYCRDCGLYFQRWSVEVDSHIDKAKARYLTDGNPLAHPFRSASVSISKLYALILDDSFERFEASLPTTRFELWLQFNHRVEYYQSLNSSNVTPSAILPRRKNLSHRNRIEGQKALFYTVCIVVLIVVDAIVSHIMNW